MACDSVDEDSQAIPLGIEKDASPPIPYNTTPAEKTSAPNHRNTVQDSLQSSSNTSLFERDLFSMANSKTENPSAPITTPEVAQQSPSGKIEPSPETQKPITQASPARPRWRWGSGSAGVRDSGYESKLSGESVQPEDRPTAETSAAACEPDASPNLFKRKFTSLLEKMK